MKKRFIPGSDIKEKTPIEEVIESSQNNHMGITLQEIEEATKASIDSTENMWHNTCVSAVSELLPAQEVVSKGERLIIAALLASLELQLQAERVPSIYKNKLGKEIKRIKNELGK